jgi:hypothetical protein
MNWMQEMSGFVRRLSIIHGVPVDDWRHTGCSAHLTLAAGTVDSERWINTGAVYIEIF